MKSKTPYFSIVIPSLNEEKFLPRLLSDLADQSWSDFEVVHVDGKSSDKTVAAAKRFVSRLDLKQIVCDKQNVSHQRNLGAEKAVGEWIIFMDADVGLPEDFLLAVRYKIALADRNPKTRFDVFSNLIKLDKKDKEKAKHNVTVRTINSYLRSTALSDKPHVFGAMIGMRSRLFGAVRFDHNIKFAEDVYFLQALIGLGAEYKLLRTPTYEYSMRRWDDTNLVKNAAKAMKLQLKIGFGDKYDDADYEMAGGSNYN